MERKANTNSASKANCLLLGCDMVSRRGYHHRHVRLLLVLEALLLLSSPTIMVHSFMPSLCFRPLLRRSRWYRFASNTDTTTTTTQPEPPAPSSSASSSAAAEETQQQQQQPLLLAEGILAVDKPLDWTSSDVVSYIRGMLERDARQRGLRPGKVGRKNGRRSRDKKNSNGVIRVGHGGTLDPLATGVLVVAVGKGTKELQRCVHIIMKWCYLYRYWWEWFAFGFIRWAFWTSRRSCCCGWACYRFVVWMYAHLLIS